MTGVLTVRPLVLRSGFVWAHLLSCLFSCALVWIYSTAVTGGPQLSGSDLRSILHDYAVALLTRRAGDSNSRCAAGALRVLKRMTTHPRLDPSFVPALALAHTPNPRAPSRSLLAHISFLSWAVTGTTTGRGGGGDDENDNDDDDDNGDGRDNGSRRVHDAARLFGGDSAVHGFPGDLVVFLRRAKMLDHAVKEVRDAARQLVVEAALKAGPAAAGAAAKTSKATTTPATTPATPAAVATHLDGLPAKLRAEIDRLIEAARERGARVAGVGVWCGVALDVGG
jgi:hypothetical protein